MGTGQASYSALAITANSSFSFLLPQPPFHHFSRLFALAESGYSSVNSTTSGVRYFVDLTLPSLCSLNRRLKSFVEPTYVLKSFLLCKIYTVYIAQVGAGRLAKGRRASLITLNKACGVMSGIRESNPYLILGKDAYYHCTNPALYEVEVSSLYHGHYCMAEFASAAAN